MKKSVLINIILVLALTGCSLWPRAHDPALAQSFVTVKLSVADVSCEDKATFDRAIKEAVWLKTYSDFRTDPQKESAAGLVNDLEKAKAAGSPKVCEHWVNLGKQRLEVLNKAWSGR